MTAYGNAASDIKNMYFKLNNIVAKADVWRYTILLNKGGVYLDIDSEIIGLLSSLINEKDEGIITAEKNKNLFVQWALIFNRNHPILSLTLDNILEAISEEKYKFDHHSLTVKTYAEAIFTLSRNNGEEVDWSKIILQLIRRLNATTVLLDYMASTITNILILNISLTTSFEIGIRESFLKITGLKSKKVRVSTKNKIWLKALIIISVNKNWIIFVK